MQVLTLGAVEARNQWSDILDDAQHHDAACIITRHGKKAAVLVPWEFYRAALGDPEPSEVQGDAR